MENRYNLTLYGRWPVCVMLCTVSFDRFLNIFPHPSTLHMNIVTGFDACGDSVLS